MSSTISRDNFEVNCNIPTLPRGEDTKNITDDLTRPSEGSLPPTVPQWVYIQNPPTTSISEMDTLAPLHFTNLTNIIPMPQPISVLVSQQNTVLPQSTNNYKPQLPTTQPQVIKNPSNLPVTLASNNPLNFTMIQPAAAQNKGLIPSIPKKPLLIAPMPKVGSNHVPVTVTTNSVQSKFTSQSQAMENHPTLQNKPKMINVKIANGKIQSGNNGAITVMCNDIPKLRKGKLNNVKEENDQRSFEEIINSRYMPWENTSLSPTNNQVLDSNDLSKVPKHGVSILKKNFALDMKCEKPIVNNVINPIITTVSDTTPKETQITTSYNNNEETVINIVTAPHQKSERRRKSNFACRQDYDEIIFTETTVVDKPPVKEKKKKIVEIENDPEVQMTTEKPNIKPDINMNEELGGIKELLVWEDGIGSLPGSDIKFEFNKYDFLQVLSKNEYIQIMNKKASKPKLKDSSSEEMCCLHCGCFGLPTEFISPKYCSYDCRDAGVKAAKVKERKLRLKAINWHRKSKEVAPRPVEPVVEIKIEKQELPMVVSEDEMNTSNENSQDKYSFPWNCGKKGFSWTKYLDHVKAKAAPVKLFREPFPYNRNGFKPGMKLEGIDPQHPSYFCVLTVVEVIGYRLRLHFDGYSDNYDFWVNADCIDIFPAGWCERTGHELHPPPPFKANEFNWNIYIKNTRCLLAPKHLFADRSGNAICPNGFRIGMKLEAVDRKNTSLVCVATVIDTMDNRLLIHFDSWDDIYDYWTDPTSPYIHPVGWADQNGHSLTPPNDYPNPKSFTWENYLKERKVVAAPVRAFKQRPPCGFKKGMRLECVDKRVPRLIRAATVDDFKEHQIRISFDGWPDRYSYWVDSDSPNIHPVGWCQKTGHPIEPPLTPADVYDFLECPTVGCRGQGHIEGAKNSTHSLTSECPYSDENIMNENFHPDRLLSPDKQLLSVVPVSREPREKSKRTNKAKRVLKTESSECDVSTDMENEESKPKIVKVKLEPEDKDLKLPLTNGYMNDDVEQMWDKNSKFLELHIKNINNPQMWEPPDVVQFISSLPDCVKYSALFKEHHIDGPALLMLSQKDLIDILHIKLGPAIKIYSIIVLLRRRILCH